MISETAPPTILRSGVKSPLTKAFVLIAPFLDQINTIILCQAVPVVPPAKISNFDLK